MTTSIAQTPQYKLSVSKAKNRAYLTIIGFWRNPEEVSEYIADWKKAVAATHSRLYPVNRCPRNEDTPSHCKRAA